jgi:hypothetical protein
MLKVMLSKTQLITEFQDVVDTWEQCLRTTCGAVVPEKSFWYLISFRWIGSQWRYESVAEAPATIFVNDINGQRKPLKCIEPYQLETTLGVSLAPDGNTNGQFDKLFTAANIWADQMRTGAPARHNASLAINSTIWRTLSYGLPATNLTKAQCKKIMSPVIQYGLPALGICKTFPRTIIHAPVTDMGLGLHHLYTLQEAL